MNGIFDLKFTTANVLIVFFSIMLYIYEIFLKIHLV
jgi:hypothetical protein